MIFFTKKLHSKWLSILQSKLSFTFRTLCSYLLLSDFILETFCAKNFNFTFIIISVKQSTNRNALWDTQNGRQTRFRFVYSCLEPCFVCRPQANFFIHKFPLAILYFAFLSYLFSFTHLLQQHRKSIWKVKS